MRMLTFLWYVLATVVRTVMGVIQNIAEQAAGKPAARGAAQGAVQGLGMIYSFEAEVLRRKPMTELPRQKQSGGIVLAFKPREGAAAVPQSRSEQWQIWRENNRMLFQSSA